MTTESVSPRFAGIDAWPPADILDALVEGQLAAVAAVRAARPALEAAALAVEARMRRGGRLVYAGAGTSGRLAVQDGAELTPTFGWPPERLVFLLAGGERALLHPVERAEDQAEDGAGEARAAGLSPDDAVVAVAASGSTPYTLGILREARRVGALGIGIANNPGTPLLSEADHGILLDTGAESIAGSTRMKAGTAQKVALNLLSSLVMIRLGRVHDGLMVDVQAVNAKLERRSIAMLTHLTGCTPDAAGDALERAGGHVKLAVLLVEGASPERARDALEQAGGRLRDALAMLKG
ncbi:N-acetylmuramic acid 6-phosphate etherase [Salinarimonas soli]|uniref:N-acetylmuramic acid 6-phosphate etherase n=1 Tax=Salinarimonas soli TaxID=1638099 RepID=A0A5B2VD00_9HYPH|nr:N-acetylmuramic acid 6-phosphate etherase [Salinarimonas soli]KAA2236864.1 N-acetylmuramic acid 6-phosphate etherase [Salinarimonas soli]